MKNNKKNRKELKEEIEDMDRRWRLTKEDALLKKIREKEKVLESMENNAERQFAIKMLLGAILGMTAMTIVMGLERRFYYEEQKQIVEESIRNNDLEKAEKAMKNLDKDLAYYDETKKQFDNAWGYEKGTQYYNGGQYEKAFEELKKAKGYKDANSCMMDIAMYYYRQDNYEKAEVVFKEIGDETSKRYIKRMEEERWRYDVYRLHETAKQYEKEGEAEKAAVLYEMLAVKDYKDSRKKYNVLAKKLGKERKKWQTQD